MSFIKNTRPYIAFRRQAKKVKRLIRLPQYLGRDLECPICHVGLRAFRPIWKSYWRDSERFEHKYRGSEMETFNLQAFSCPRCDATDRERLIKIYLDRVLPALTTTRVPKLIDFAPSEALRGTLRSIPGIAYHTADLSRADVQEHIDLTDIRYPDGSWDIFLCSHVLEHIPDDRKAMSELCRILKADGFGLVLVPIVIGVEDTQEDETIRGEAACWKHFGAGDHVRQYGRRDFLDRLAAAGFAVEQCGVDFFGCEAFRRAGIADNSILYVVRKSAQPSTAAKAAVSAAPP
jgi:SAM-dependent methyltransferase